MKEKTLGEKVLIVGGGLSGICIAHQLESADIDFLIIDQGLNESSAIAAGMINPMVFRKMVKTWKGDDLIPYLKDFYTRVEKITGLRFFYPRKIRRVFSTPEERNYWQQRQEDSSYDDYLFNLREGQPAPSYVISKYGSGIVNSPGYVDAKKFMKANHDYFIKQDKLRYENFNFQLLDIQNKRYASDHFSQIVFAEGYRGKFNPYFNYLPLQQTKGEVLTVRSASFVNSEILNRKCFVLPLEGGDFKLGATFSWDTTDTSPTEKAREQLLNQYEQLSTADLEILAQEGGIRPTVTDRRPLIGEHPNYKGLHIFNGMGTKGYMIAPYYSKQFVEHLIKGESLDQEVNIDRFYKKHFLKK